MPDLIDGTAYRRLAVGVLRRAVLDGRSEPSRAWCELAGIEPEAIGRLARRLGEPACSAITT